MHEAQGNLQAKWPLAMFLVALSGFGDHYCIDIEQLFIHLTHEIIPCYLKYCRKTLRTRPYHVKKAKTHISPEERGMQRNHVKFMGQERWFLIVSFLRARTSRPTRSHGFGCVSGPILLIAVICSTNGPSLERLVEHLVLNRSRKTKRLVFDRPKMQRLL